LLRDLATLTRNTVRFGNGLCTTVLSTTPGSTTMGRQDARAVEIGRQVIAAGYTVLFVTVPTPPNSFILDKICYQE
jgi:hypothetical protein